MRSRMVMGGLLILGLALSACSSSPTGGATTTTAPSKASELALARTGLIDLGDLPAGWTSSGKITSGSGGPGNNLPTAKLAACLGISNAEFNATGPTENSPTFSDAQGVSSVDDQV